VAELARDGTAGGGRDGSSVGIGMTPVEPATPGEMLEGFRRGFETMEVTMRPLDNLWPYSRDIRRIAADSTVNRAVHTTRQRPPVIESVG